MKLLNISELLKLTWILQISGWVTLSSSLLPRCWSLANQIKTHCKAQLALTKTFSYHQRFPFVMSWEQSLLHEESRFLYLSWNFWFTLKKRCFQIEETCSKLHSAAGFLSFLHRKTNFTDLNIDFQRILFILHILRIPFSISKDLCVFTKKTQTKRMFMLLIYTGEGEKISRKIHVTFNQ